MTYAFILLQFILLVVGIAGAILDTKARTRTENFALVFNAVQFVWAGLLLNGVIR